jgi:hypothetical protein
MSTTPEQLRLAADILEKGLEWEVLIGGVWSENTVKLSLVRWIDDGYEIRIKPQPDPYAELKAAHAAGKAIQAQWTDNIGTDLWDDVIPDWTIPVKQYRIKPKPEYVPLEANDVHPGDVFRISDTNRQFHWFTPEGVADFAIRFRHKEYSWQDAVELLEISRDGGKTWHPCRKVKEAQS